jgi:hypothetical protein
MQLSSRLDAVVSRLDTQAKMQMVRVWGSVERLSSSSSALVIAALA